MFVCKIQNNKPVSVNGWLSRIEIREYITAMLDRRLPVNDDAVYRVVVFCVNEEFVEELQLAVSLPRSPVEYCIAFICVWVVQSFFLTFGLNSNLVGL